MKTPLFAAAALVAMLSSARAQNSLPTAPASPPPYVYDQRSYAHVPVLIDPAAAQMIVDNFRTNLPSLGGQRFLIYVNRNLPGDAAGLKLTGRSETVDTTSTSASSADTNAAPSVTTHTVAHNTFEDNGKAAPTLADRQTVRDVERLVARPLRTAGARLIDDATVTRLNGGHSPEATSFQNATSRDTLSRVADVAIEVLISSLRDCPRSHWRQNLSRPRHPDDRHPLE